MTGPGQMFSDGKVYERMMGRWSKLVGRIFLDWLAAPKSLHWYFVSRPRSNGRVCSLAGSLRPICGTLPAAAFRWRRSVVR